MLNPESNETTTTTTTIVPQNVGVIRKKVTEKDLEKWEVAQLKSDIVPYSRPSVLFEELEERRKARHEDVLRQLTADLQAINLKMENNVKLSSEELKAHMKYFNDKLQGIIQMFDVFETSAQESADFAYFQKKVKKYRTKQQVMVEELYQDLIKFENERAAAIDKLLRNSFEKIQNICFLLPYEIQAFAEQEILALNQLTLNNRRNFEDLRLILTLVTEQTFKYFVDKVDCIKEKLDQRKLHRALLNMEIPFEKKSLPRRLSETFSVMDLKSEELIADMSYDTNHSARKADEWMKKVQDAVVAIEFHGKELIEVHKKIVSGIYQNFDEKAQCIKKELTELEILDIEELSIQPFMYAQERDIEELELYWNDNIAEIRVQLMHVNEFLLDLGKLWDRHAERICESEKLIQQALRKADEINRAVLQDLEVKLNIALDALRQEHTKKQLEIRHEEVIAILNSIKSEYETMYLNDVNIVEDFYKMMNLEGDVLCAEFKEFIYETQPLDPTRILHCYVDSQRSTIQGRQITKAIAGCVQRIRAVKQWQFGIWSAINALSEQTRDTLHPRAEKWVQKRIEILADKKTVELELLRKRFERIKAEIFEKRMGEIETHEKRFDDHRKEIDTTIAQLKEGLDDLVKRETDKLLQRREELQKCEEEAKSEDRPGRIYAKLKMAERNKKKFEEELVANFENYRATVQTRLFDLKQTNINFMESIKLFYEGGDYSSQESKIYANALEAIDKELETELNNLEKEILRKQGEIAKNISPVFDPPIATLTSLYEETLFEVQMREKLHFFQTELQQFSDVLEEDVSILNKEAFNIYEYISNRKKPLDETICRAWYCLFRLLYLNASHLFYRMEFEQIPEEYSKGEAESVEGEFTLAMVPCPKFTWKPVKFKNISRREKEDAKFACKDFKSELFGSQFPPENDCSYMGAIQYRLYMTLDAFQKAACDFYKNEDRKIIRSDLLPPTYEAFMKNIINRFKSYNDQCQQFWLSTMKDFLPILARIKLVGNTYVERKLAEYDADVKKALKIFEEDFEACLDHLLEKSRDELKNLDERLLTLYGYPQNQDLLSALEEEVVRRTAALGIVWETAIKKFKNSIKCFRLEHVTERKEIRKLEAEYTIFKKTLFVNDLGDGLLDTILGYCDAGGYRPRNLLFDYAKGKYNDMEEGEFSPEWDLRLQKKSDIKTVEWHLNYLREIVERERLAGDQLPEYPPCPEGTLNSYIPEEDASPRANTTPFHILLELLDFNEYAEDILKNLSLVLGRLKELATSKSKVQEEELFKWLSRWKVNVKNLQEVYCINGDKKPEVTSAIR